MNSMDIEAWGQTDVGLVRSINQDTILVDQNLGLYIVADGMGGHKGGEVASAMAVETVREIVENNVSQGSPLSPREVLHQAYREASMRIYHKSSKESPELQGMGTTMVAALAKGNTLYFGNVGDSRAYLFRDSEMWQVTEDHSLVSEQIRAGILSEKEAEQVATRNVITRSVGYEPEVPVDVIERQMHRGEMVLMCSDGLTGMVSDIEIAGICKSEANDKVVGLCVEAAKKGGGDDNISVILLKIL